MAAAVSSFEARFTQRFHQDLPPPLPRTVTAFLYGPSSDMNSQETAPAPPSRRKRQQQKQQQQHHPPPLPQQYHHHHHHHQQQHKHRHLHHYHRHQSTSAVVNLASELLPLHLGIYALNSSSSSTTTTTKEESVRGDGKSVRVSETAKYEHHTLKTREKRRPPCHHHEEGNPKRPSSKPPSDTPEEGRRGVWGPGHADFDTMIREYRKKGSQEHVYEVDFDWMNNNKPSTVKGHDDASDGWNTRGLLRSQRRSSTSIAHPDQQEEEQCGRKTADSKVQEAKVLKTARKKNPPQKPPRKSQNVISRVSFESDQRYCENENNYNSNVIISNGKGSKKCKSFSKSNSLCKTQSRPSSQTTSDCPVRPERVKSKAKSQACDESTTGKLNNMARYYFSEGPGRRDAHPAAGSEQRDSRSAASSLRRQEGCSTHTDSTRRGKEGARGPSVRRKKDATTPAEQNSGQMPRRERKSSYKSRPSFKLSVRSKVMITNKASGGRTPNTPRQNSSGSSRGRRQSLKTSTSVTEAPNPSQSMANPPPSTALHHNHHHQQQQASSPLERYDFSLPRVVLSGESNLAKCRVSSRELPRGKETWPRGSCCPSPSLSTDDTYSLDSTDAPEHNPSHDRSSASGPQVAPLDHYVPGCISPFGHAFPSGHVSPGHVSPSGHGSPRVQNPPSGQYSPESHRTSPRGNTTSSNPHTSPTSTTSSRVRVASSRGHSPAGSPPSAPSAASSLLQHQPPGGEEVGVLSDNDDDDVLILSHTSTASTPAALSHTNTTTTTPGLSHSLRHTTLVTIN